MKTFITGLGSEFQKLVWPKWDEALGHAILVLTIAVVIGYYIGAFDALFAAGLKLIIG